MSKSTLPNRSGIHDSQDSSFTCLELHGSKCLVPRACPNGINKDPTKKDGKLICSPTLPSNGKGDKDRWKMSSPQRRPFK